MNFINKLLELRQKYMNYMQGRYGVDDLSKAMAFLAIGLMALSWIMSIISGLMKSPKGTLLALGINFIVLLIFILIALRTISFDINKEYFRNQKYIYYRDKFIEFIKNIGNPESPGKTHKIYKCPKCRQKIRVPRGKGKIAIRCPKCKKEFIRKT